MNLPHNQSSKDEDMEEYIQLRYKITDPIEAFNLFIKRNIPDLYAHFIDDDENEAEFVRQIIKDAISSEKQRSELDEEHLLDVMETGKELSKQYQKYDGDMDWVEFVRTRYIEPRQKALKQTKGEK